MHHSFFRAWKSTSQVLLLAGTTVLASLHGTAAFAASFKDVPESNPAYGAVEFLKQTGVLSGYEDGTFRPKQNVTRAEAVKILVSTLTTSDKLPTTNPPYDDVAPGVWYAPYVEAARTTFAIIDGPPKTSTFKGGSSVKKAEFLKMMILTTKSDPNSYGDVRLPVATDVTDADAWFYPYVRFGLASSVLLVQADGSIQPGQDLTRGDVASYLYRLAMYKAGRRTQALLSAEETDLINVMQLLEKQDIISAEQASARALLAAKGSYASKPDNMTVQGALKTAEAFRSIVRGYKAGMDKNFEETIRLAKEAWSLAEQAKEKSPSLATLSVQVQTVATNMAAEARKVMEAPAE